MSDEKNVVKSVGKAFAVLQAFGPDAPELVLAEVARAAGIDYIAIPVTHAGFSEAQVSAMRAALEKTPGPVLAYCRSGTRSTLLWALAQSSLGEHPAVLAEKAAGAGYDLAPVATLMDILRAKA